MQAKLADMYTSLQSSRAMVYSIAKQVDEGYLSNVVYYKCDSIGLC